MSNRPVRESERNQDATVYVGNLDERVTEELFYELMIQAGPVVSVHMPKDRVNGQYQGFGFAEYRTEKDADYAALILHQIRLYGKQLRINKASLEKQKTLSIGAELFIGNLDPLVDEQVLLNTFSSFGNILQQPRVARDEDGKSQGYAFVAYDSFESSDKAIENMNSQYLMNSQIRVSYAYKREGKGERHGNEAERRLAAQATRHNYTIQPLAPIVPLNDSAPPPVPSLPPGFGVGTNGKTAIPPPPAGF